MRLLLALLLGGCSQQTDLLTLPDGGQCPPITIGGECAGAAAARRLRYALCSCSPLILPHGLLTQGGSGMLGPPTAAVGTDQQVQLAGPAQVGGAMVAAGSFGIAFGRSAGILGTLRSGGTLASQQFLSISGDAFVDGDVRGQVDIDGVLHVPSGAAISSSVSAAGLRVEPVAVEPPCDCGAAPDLIGLINDHAMLNDNPRIHLDPGALTGSQSVLELPCGAFYLSLIKMAPGMELELRVHGRAALFVAGDVNLGDGLRVELDPMAELDLVVGGDLRASSGAIGGPDAPQVRLWLAGKSVQLGHYAGLSASVYAPHAVVLADGNLDVDGALFAAAVSAPGDVIVHYQAEILNAGASCGAPPESAIE